MTTQTLLYSFHGGLVAFALFCAFLAEFCTWLETRYPSRVAVRVTTSPKPRSR